MNEPRKIKLGEQIAAVRAGARVLSGAEKPPKGAAEREYQSRCISAGAETLEKLRDNTPEILKGKDAIALLRRRLPELPADMREEVVALLVQEESRSTKHSDGGRE